MTRLAMACLLGCAVAAGAQQASKMQQPAVVAAPNPDFSHCHAVSRDHLKAAAVVSLVVKEDGSPDLVGIADTSGNACFDEEAMNTVKKYRFRPAVRDGKPVATNIKVEVKMEMKPKN